MKRNYSILLFLLCLLLNSCSSSVKKGKEAVVTGMEIEFSQLITNIQYYHGKIIKTKGRYLSGFEESGLYNITPMSDSSAEKFIPNSRRGIWVEFNINKNKSKSEILKSLPKSNTIVTIQGMIDTTSKGHLGQYAATLRGAKLISSK